jgi:hypothetical protein
METNPAPQEADINRAAPARKIPRWLKFLLGIPLICSGLCGAMYWFVEVRPQFVEFNFPNMDGMITWGYTERSVLSWDGGSTSYLWRQEAICPVASCKSWEAIWQHYDSYLKAEGWVRVDERFGTPCSISAPETASMAVGIGGYVVYVQEKEMNNGFCHGPEFCLAIWDDKGYFNVVTSSNNNSFLTELGECMG